MASIVLGARVLLAAVFAIAGVGKLLDLSGSRRAVAGFGVPARAASVTGLLLPLAELGTAVALVFPSSARWGAVAALALLVGFGAGIANALARGRAPDCHCFGQLHSAPAGRGTLVRNGVLAAIAAVVVWRGPGPMVDGWVAARRPAELVSVGIGACAAILAALSVRLWLEKRRLQAELVNPRVVPAVGAPAPSFTLPGVRGETLTLDSLRAHGRPVALVFVQPGCGPCLALMPELGRWQTTLANRLTIVLVSSGSVDENRPACEEHGVADVLLQKRFEVVEAYGIAGTPGAVVVAPDGAIASAPAVGPEAVEALIRVALRAPEPGRVDQQDVTLGPVA
jgi:peroxiredoxin/uncharacterized membrane protein YphA (DoxX/SURF4 family)